MAGKIADTVSIFSQTCCLQFSISNKVVSKRQKTPCHLKQGQCWNLFQVQELSFFFARYWVVASYQLENASMVKKCTKIGIFNQLVAHFSDKAFADKKGYHDNLPFMASFDKRLQIIVTHLYFSKDSVCSLKHYPTQDPLNDSCNLFNRRTFHSVKI